MGFRFLAASNTPKPTSDFVLLGLGKFQFSVHRASYESIKSRYEFSWNPLQRLGGVPALQFTGENNPTLSFSAVVVPQISGDNGIQAVNRILLEARKKEPLELVDSQGFSLGRWVILNIEKEESFFTTDKDVVHPRKISIYLTLKYFGE
jgi:phage protein U